MHKADYRMSPTERKAIWPEFAAVLEVNGGTTLQLLREFANILDTVPDAHKSEFVAMSAGIARHFNRVPTTPGSSVQAQETVVLAPGLSEFEDDSESTDSESDSETESAYFDTEPGTYYSDDIRTMTGDTDDTRTMAGDMDDKQGAPVRGPGTSESMWKTWTATTWRGSTAATRGISDSSFTLTTRPGAVRRSGRFEAQDLFSAQGPPCAHRQPIRFKDRTSQCTLCLHAGLVQAAGLGGSIGYEHCGYFHCANNN
jgi:hypothetical protein